MTILTHDCGATSGAFQDRDTSSRLPASTSLGLRLRPPLHTFAGAAADSNGDDADIDSSSSSGSDGEEAPGGEAPAATPPVQEKWTGPMAGCTAVAALVSEGVLTVSSA